MIDVSVGDMEPLKQQVLSNLQAACETGDLDALVLRIREHRGSEGVDGLQELQQGLVRPTSAAQQVRPTSSAGARRGSVEAAQGLDPGVGFPSVRLPHETLVFCHEIRKHSATRRDVPVSIDVWRHTPRGGVALLD